jgi:hypothetical protein
MRTTEQQVKTENERKRGEHDLLFAKESKRNVNEPMKCICLGGGGVEMTNLFLFSSFSIIIYIF